MICNLEKIIKFLESLISSLESLISSFTGRSPQHYRTTYKTCSQLNENLDTLIEMANDTAHKSTIYKMRRKIMSEVMDMESCDETHMENIKEYQLQLCRIVCKLKELLGEECLSSCTTTASHTTSTVLPQVSTSIIKSTGTKLLLSIQATTFISTPGRQSFTTTRTKPD